MVESGFSWFRNLGEVADGDVGEDDSENAHEHRYSEYKVGDRTYRSKHAYISIMQGRKRKMVMDRRSRFWLAGSDQFKDLRDSDTTDENAIIVGSWVLAWVNIPGSLTE